MDIRAELQRSRSKSNITELVAYIGDDAALFDELMQIVLHDRSKYRWVASWCMSDCIGKHPGLLHPYIDTLVKQMQDPLDVGTKRNYVRVLQAVPVPEHLRFDLADICLGYLRDKDEAIAVKAFALTILQHLAVYIPGLKEELVFEIERQVPYATAAFKSRGKRVLKALATMK